MIKSIFIVLTFGFLVWSCDDIVGVEDISDGMVTILAPADGVNLTSSNVSFSWNSMTDAEVYRLQIASPNFDNAVQILVDSSLTSTVFSKTLESGTYQWRIRAENSDYQTIYNTQSFTVSTEAVDISNVQVVLLAPANTAVFSTTDAIQFSWETVLNAENYRFQIATPNFENAVEIIVDQSVTATSFSTVNLESNSYEWRVKASNSLNSTEYSTHNFTVEE